MFGHIIKGIVVLPPHASTIEREKEDKKICSTLSSLFFLFRTLFLTFSVLSFTSLYLSPHYLFSLSIFPYSLSPILSPILSLPLSLLLSSLILPLSYSHSYYLSYSLSTLSPLSSSHSLISCSLSYRPLFLRRSLLFCLSPILSLLLSLAIYPTFSYSLSLPPDFSLSPTLSLILSLLLSTLSSISLSPFSYSLPSLSLCVSLLWVSVGVILQSTIPYIPFIHVIKTMKDYAVV